MTWWEGTLKVKFHANDFRFEGKGTFCGTVSAFHIYDRKFCKFRKSLSKFSRVINTDFSSFKGNYLFYRRLESQRTVHGRFIIVRKAPRAL